MDMTKVGAILILSTLWIGCGDPATPEDAGDVDSSADDAGTDAPSVALCASDLECDDDLFCNGVERCVPGEAGTDARGCLPAETDRCEATQSCDEAGDECVSDCGTDPDADRDGHDAVLCGGNDCDDSDPEVNPGVMEQCDAAGRDEDCVPSTLGPDADMDGYVFAMCCNRQMDGSMLCGTDCDDMNGEINPDAIEVCNGLDDNCDGMLDPTIEDGDGDGWARCADLPEAMRDCDDMSAMTFPGASELCDGLDNDCDGAATGEDEDNDGFMATDVTCTGGSHADRPRTDCDDTSPSIAPDQPEQCNATDHNCNGSNDEAPAADSCLPIANTTFGCVAEACAVSSCGIGFGDCDSSAANGCEQPLNTNAFCGSCGTSCRWECADGSCNDPTQTTAGYDHTCSVLAGGRVRCWGANDQGQLGLGSSSTVPSTRPGPVVQRVLAPVGVGPLEDVEELALGLYFACARTVAGDVLCWGANDVGQLGETPGAPSPYARLLTSVPSATSISTGIFHGCAVVAGGSVHCWGGNGHGQVGSTIDPQPSPVTVAGIVGASVVEVGSDVSCAVVSGGEVWCWGSNAAGLLGRGSVGGDFRTPAPVVSVSGPGNLTGVDEIAAGGGHVCARLGGEVVCWGDNGHGELGDGTTVGRSRPAYVMDGGARLTGVTNISAGFSFSCAEIAGGVRCWGRNHIGQLGDGSFSESRALPVTVQHQSGGALSGVDRLSHSMAHTCVQAGPDPICWGFNGWGQLGNGDRLARDSAGPALPPLLP